MSRKKKQRSTVVDTEQETVNVISDVQSEEDTQLKRRHVQFLFCCDLADNTD